MKKQTIGLISVVFLVLTIVLSFILYNEWPLLTGKKIVLAIQPIDPFDPFRGQYMSINYEISTINNVEGFIEGDSIYVTLEKDEQGIWRLKETSKTKPSEGIFIKGKITNSYDKRVWVEYGVEQFFFERNAMLPTSNISVEVRVSNSGRAKLVQLLKNGEPIEIEYEKFDIRS